MGKKDIKTPGNITYGDGTANYRMRYKQMLEEHNSKTNKNNKTKKKIEERNKKKVKNKKDENPMDRITRILYGGNNK